MTNELAIREFKPIELDQLPDKPLVSVLIPNYNYAKYIGEALESLLCQTYSHFEAIVCDDGSTDFSCEVVEVYMQIDSRIKLIRQQNGGVASAINAAYRVSCGQIVCLLDADDLWIPNKLQKVVNACQTNSQAGFIIHNAIVVDGNKKCIQSKPMLKQLASGWIASSTLDNGGVAADIPPASALSFRREVADLIFPINETFTRNADNLILSLAVLLTIVVPVAETLTLYRLHGKNLSGTLSVTIEDFQKGQHIFERVHQEQKRFLTNVFDRKTADRLKELTFSFAYLQNTYLLTRLKSESNSSSREVHGQLIAHPQFGKSPIDRWLLRRGEDLPIALFNLLFHFAYGSSWLKRLVKQVITRLPNASYTHG